MAKLWNFIFVNGIYVCSVTDHEGTLRSEVRGEGRGWIQNYPGISLEIS